MPRIPFHCKYCVLSSHSFDRLKRHEERRHRRLVLRDFTNCTPIHHKGRDIITKKPQHALEFDISQCMKCEVYFQGFLIFDKITTSKLSQSLTVFKGECCRICATEGREHTSKRNASTRPYTGNEVTNNKKYKCKNCLQQFPGAKHLVIHIKSKSCKREKSYQCPYCDKRYMWINTLQVHMRIAHLNEIPYYVRLCKRCGLSQHCDLATQAHTQLKPNNKAEKSCKCCACMESPISTTQLAAKCTTQTKINMFQCEHCQKYFNLSQVEFELRSTFCEGKTPFHCNTCQHQFTNGTYLTRHIQIPKKKPLQCDYCHERIAENVALKDHLEICMGDPALIAINKPYQCELCQRRFRQKCDLKRHSVSAHGIISYECQYCHEFYGSYRDFHAHLETHKEDKIIKDKLHQCEHCQQYFSQALCVSHRKTCKMKKCYQCDLCQERFMYKVDVKKHIYSVHEREPVQCDYCLEYFAENDTYESHLKICENKPLQCDYCRSYFAQTDTYESHLKTCTENQAAGAIPDTDNDKPFQCYHCNESFTQTDAFKVKAHLKICIEDPTDKVIPDKVILDKLYGSEICQAQPEKSDPQKNSAASYQMKSYKCKVCHECFIKFRDFASHMESHAKLEDIIKKEDETDYQCGYCQKLFQFQGNLTRHIRDHAKRKLHRCEYCQKSFSTAKFCSEHMFKNGSTEPYQCPFCDEQFTHACAYKQHEGGTHNVLHQCEQCQKCFPNKGRLRAHVRTHTNERPYKCDYCHKCLTTSGHLKMHIRTHTGEKPFVCDYCGKAFPRNYQMKLHLRTHTKEKPYQCEQCGKRFTARSQYTAHNRTHTKEKPYECDKCKKCFARNDHLIRHKETAHGAGKPSYNLEN